jgi:hypothetical protein
MTSFRGKAGWAIRYYLGRGGAKINCIPLDQKCKQNIITDLAFYKHSFNLEVDVKFVENLCQPTKSLPVTFESLSDLH